MDSFIDFEKIENTEASIDRNSFSRWNAELTKVAGFIDQKSIKLVVASSEFQHLPSWQKPHLSLSIKIYDWTSLFCFGSTSQLCPLHKGDNVVIKLDSGNSMMLEIMVGGLKDGIERKNWTTLTDQQLIALMEQSIEHCEVQSRKTGAIVRFEFASDGLITYSNPTEGRMLFRVMTKRIIGAKSLLRDMRTKIG